ncbi:MAG: hypothetical protein ACUVTP_09045 [Candidatus Fervidibacter sp.]|uniref:hypothetical protein n=1 Tax=Candidatus Fervidibacter sp. TaxID=3100871 RepID=UPI00404A5608
MAEGIAHFFTGWLILPWIYGIVDAVTVANEIRNGIRESATVPPGYLLLIIKFGVVPFACVYLSVLIAIVMAVYGLMKLILALD